MKNKRLIIIIISIIIALLCIVKIQDTYHKYGETDRRFYNIGEKIEVKDVAYTLQSIEEYTYDEMLVRCSMDKPIEYDEVAENKKYFLFTFQLEGLNDNSTFYIMDMGGQIRYNPLQTGELNFMMELNGSISDVILTAGENKTFYIVLAASDFYFRDETFKNLAVNDAAVEIFDWNTGISHYFVSDKTLWGD